MFLWGYWRIHIRGYASWLGKTFWTYIEKFSRKALPRCSSKQTVPRCCVAVHTVPFYGMVVHFFNLFNITIQRQFPSSNQWMKMGKDSLLNRPKVCGACWYNVSSILQAPVMVCEQMLANSTVNAGKRTSTREIFTPTRNTSAAANLSLDALTARTRPSKKFTSRFICQILIVLSLWVPTLLLII